MKNMIQISESELEVMKVLWNIKSGTSSQIIEKLSTITDWKPKTIQTLITRLVTKGALKVDKSNKKSYIYYPNIGEDEYKNLASSSFLEKLYNGSINMMVASFIKNKKMSKDDIEELKNLLDED
ncbi:MULTISPECIES: BlaI/MecI/CopY family transcriptional regulator [unclassified Romboutsia]|uniref:BlaI/MecI/CopY family transcriptional regulator n=1 Tax=unclassified Romboutsia TaxID=2626894 RepID=UPI00082166E8|nr:MULTISPECIES: BlaI/MecI/CopY family transcriptional regulator [unclassified Romboutsia]SCH13829.1 Regulatory protein BlaI [uncultured Clostridium sp.]